MSQTNSNNPEIVFETTLGSFTVRLFQDQAPLSGQNMIEYAKAGFYDGTIFHRVIGNFMIQGGGFTSDFGRKETRAPIKNEATNGLKNKRGTLSMARTSVVDSATSQFFINVVDNVSLDHRGSDMMSYGYAVFGEISSGMDVVDAIRNVKTLCPSSAPGPCNAPLPPGMRDVPETPVVIQKAYVKS